ncbi:MAG: aminodeoxychorismate lyase [Gammaproteobacteria bacterium]|nr:aminodeoxychorismate lyase [Gammaproteobacteria bacterium]MDH5239845.1 aminodeoxychorismate lyase [Gammaproteobacteria bacterium]MDH5260753.1 aminodeoxychorismate lyase [Gammaproteobacteria bacterium]MDH5583189.1 aminodeoxychorismate lyase [Gammaproteobacteria bacterium]
MSDWFDAKGAIDAVEISERGFQYGDGLFETIAIRDGQPRLWNYHMDRMAAGCARLALHKPAAEDLWAGVETALQQSGLAEDRCVVKLILTAGAGERGYGRSAVDVPSVYYGVYTATAASKESYRNGIETLVCATRLAIHSATAGMKTLNRLEQVLARSELAGTGMFEGLTMDAEGEVICGTMSNLFVVHDGRLSTPSLARCGVEGVMRRHVITSLAEQGIQTDIRSITLADMNDSDEIFVCNSQFGVLPVRRCMEKIWPAGTVTKEVMAILADSGIAECRL